VRAREISKEKSAEVSVSVVIPTRGRAGFVQKAVMSALRQDFESIEILVVVDGEDRPTSEALEAFGDERLRVIKLAANVGGAEARNIGVREARGEWIAFLDDDDEWLPHKLSRQMVAARRSTVLWPVVSSRLIARGPEGEWIRPLRSYDSTRPVSEFLFCRKPLIDGPYAAQTSTLMMRREMMLAVPFRSGLKRHQDWDWVLRAERVPGVAFTVLSEPLVVYSMGDGRESVGRAQDWEFSMQWGAEMRGFFSAKAYSWFLATECASRAAKGRAGWKVYAELLRRFVADGRPAMGSMLMLGSFLALPQAWRGPLSTAKKWRRQTAPPTTQRNCAMTFKTEL
jgi:hypothetical protein